MHHNHLYLLTLLAALVGILLLWLVEPHYQPQPALLMHCRGTVSFEGVIEHVEAQEKFFIITLRDSSFFDVIAFEAPPMLGQRVTVTGTFQDYRGTPQIIASQVKLFK